MPIWQRVDVLRIIINRLPSWVSAVVYVLSPEDPQFDEVLSVIKDSRTPYTIAMHINNPLGAKINYGVQTALKTYRFNYLMNIGSDDIVHEDLLEAYRDKLQSLKLTDWPVNCMIGFDSGDWYQPSTGMAYRIRYWDVPILIGAGRWTSRDLAKACRGEMNDPRRKKSMDTDSQFRLQAAFSATSYKFALSGYVVDIKTEVNLNKFGLLEIADIEKWELNESEVKRRYGLGDCALQS